MVLLEARHVSKSFGGGLLHKDRTVALEDFSFAIAGEPPSITAVVGESGSGKTTLARLLLGIVAPSDGEVLYQARICASLTGAEQRAFRRDVQVIFQDPFEVYNPVLQDRSRPRDAGRQVRAGRHQGGGAGADRGRRCEAVGLRPEETLGRYPHQLSGGQRQRIMVARALLIRPRLIIADEPVSMVDASLRATILESMRQLHDEFGISLIYITHDLTTAYQISQNIIVLYRGLVAEAGDVEEVVGRPEASLHAASDRLDPAARSRPRRGGRRRRRARKTPLPSDHGCRFAARCPAVMPMCHESAPPLYRIGPHRAAACYLYRDGEVVRGDDLGAVLVGGVGAADAGAPAGGRGRDQTRRLRRGLAISSRPIEIRNSEMNRMPTTMIGASHHHHQPLMTAPVKLTQ